MKFAKREVVQGWNRVSREQVGDGRHEWLWDPDIGICVGGEPPPRRTPGRPVTVSRIDREFGYIIQSAAAARGAPIDILHRMIVAVIATESRGVKTAQRYEPHINDWSFGLCQTLTRTAANLRYLCHGDVASMFKGEWPSVLPLGQSWKEATAPVRMWRDFLSVPVNSITLCATYLSSLNSRFKLDWDPVFLYASYNAGSPRPSDNTPWGLVAYDRDGLGPEKGALDHFVAWYGDACFVLSGEAV